ncbi:hypothetical protein BKA93DRAFT_759611 [Sparassis latifolia]
METSRLYSIAHDAFRTIVPALQDRESLTLRTLPNAHLYWIPYLFLAYLVRRENTHLLRILLFPIVVLTTIACTYHYRCDSDAFLIWEFQRGLCPFIVLALSIDFACVREGRFRIGEKKLRPMFGHQEEDNRDHLLPLWLHDALDVGLAFRGIGWDFGDGYLVPSRRPTERGAFLWTTFLEILKKVLIVDFIDSFVKLVPNLGTPSGGSIFFPGLPPIQRYTFSTILNVAIELLMNLGFDVSFNCVTFIGVALHVRDPSYWREFQDKPWLASSLHELWSKRWHQVWRHPFMIVGGYSGGWIAGRVGALMGTFLASGLYHECGIFLLGKGVDHRVTLFFLLHGVGVLLEGVWRKLTGKKVGGIMGRVLVALSLLGLGQILSDSFGLAGIAGATIIPWQLSPTRLLLFPLIRYFIPSF